MWLYLQVCGLLLFYLGFGYEDCFWGACTQVVLELLFWFGLGCVVYCLCWVTWLLLLDFVVECLIYLDLNWYLLLAFVF